MIGFLLLASLILYKLWDLIVPKRYLAPSGRTVLIDGCDTGFGRAAAQKLHDLGYTVLAGCLSSDAVEELNKLFVKRQPDTERQSKAFKLDITKQDDVKAAAELVAKQYDNQLYAYVGNAGIGASGYVDWAPIEQYRKVFEVNVVGHIAMTKALMTALLNYQDEQSRGRVILIASVAGFTGAPNLSSYCISKHAVEAFGDSLRREMRVWNMPVSLIEPGYMKTNLLSTISSTGEINQKEFDSAPEDVRKRWGPDFIKSVIKAEANVMDWAENPRVVVDTIVEAVRVASPKHRYAAGLWAQFIFKPNLFLPTYISDRMMHVINTAKQIPAGVAKAH